MYITYWNPPKTRQITFDEIIAGVQNVEALHYGGSTTSTITVCRNDLTPRLQKITNIPDMIAKLTEFNQKYAGLEACDLAAHYEHFEIPKKSGGWRPIDAPDKELSDALVELREMLRTFMIADYHTNAFAYIPNRSFIDAVRKHQAGHVKTKKNEETGVQTTVTFENHWAVKFDLHGFFPSTTPDFLLGMLSIIYPFALIMKDERGHEQLANALKLCFLHGGLPQGTPISPWLTNVMMIPFDHLITRKLCYGYKAKDGIEREFTYTRYADDMMFSCYYSFDPMEIQQIVIDGLNFIHAPFTLNEAKTHYGNRHSSKNWCLGLMWNKDNQITVGWRNLKMFRSAMKNYIDVKKRGETWELEDLQKFMGKLNYYHMVEPEVIDDLVHRYNEKFHVDIIAMLKDDLRPKEGVVA